MFTPVPLEDAAADDTNPKTWVCSIVQILSSSTVMTGRYATTADKDPKTPEESAATGEAERMRTLLKTVRNSKFVRVNQTEPPGVVACNFTRRAFFKKAWNESTVKARGLFIGEKNNKIVGRGYEKFFTIDEPGHETLEQVREKITYPAVARIKENGYLAIVTVIGGALTVYSKSGVTAYSRHAENILRATFTEDELNNLTRALAAMDASLTVEVVDPFKDPHIVPYGRVSLFLLDTIANTVEFSIKSARFEDLGLDPQAFTVARSTGDYGQVAVATVREEQLANDADLMRVITQEHPTITEGLVIRDDTGYMVKTKTEHYKRVKRLRSHPAMNKFLEAAAENNPGSCAGQQVEQLQNNARAAGIDVQNYVVSTVSGHRVWDMPRLAPYLDALFTGVSAPGN